MKNDDTAWMWPAIVVLLLASILGWSKYEHEKELRESYEHKFSTCTKILKLESMYR